MAVPVGMFRRLKVRRFAPLVVLILLGGFLYAMGVMRDLSLEGLQQHREMLREMVETHRLVALAVFIAIFAAVTAAFVPAALIFTLAGGLLFGPWLGTAATVIACTIGSAVTCASVRAAAGSWLSRRFEGQAGRIQAVMEGVRRNAFFYVLALRLFPLLPFGVVNVAVGLSRAPFLPFVLATFLGAIPTSLIYSHLGASLDRALGQGQPIASALLHDPRVLVSLAALGVLALIPVVLRGRFPIRADGA